MEKVGGENGEGGKNWESGKKGRADSISSVTSLCRLEFLLPLVLQRETDTMN